MAVKAEKLEVNKLSLEQFLGMCGLKGAIENKELLVNIDSESMAARAVDFEKVVSLSGVLKGAFLVWGEVGIDDLPILKTFLSSVTNKTINLKKTENKLVCEAGKTKFTTQTRGSKYIVNNIAPEKFQTLVAKARGNEFVLSAADIKRLITAFNTVKTEFLIMESTGKELTVKCANEKDEIEVSVDIAGPINPFSIKLAKVFIELLQSISEFDITVSVNGTLTPVYVKVEKDNLKFEYLVAPLAK